jgi:hypothetical protein
MSATPTFMLQLFAFIVGLAGLFVATSSLLQNLERSRRELASALIYNWANHLDWQTSSALALLKQIDVAVIESIDDLKPASLPAVAYERVVSILKAEFSDRGLPERPMTAATFDISEEHSAHIRFLWVRWLNRLEGTLTAWQQGAASAQVMHTEFEPLVKGRRAELQKFQDAKMLDGLSVICEFCRLVKEGGRITIRPKLGIFPWGR